MKKLFVAAAAMVALIAAPVVAKNLDRPEDAEVYIISPADGETITGPVTVVMGIKGMGIAPAGVKHKNTGHHHLLIDRNPINEREKKETLPADENLIHLGGGETETVLELEPGEHTLQIVFADNSHVPFSPNLESEQITITVAAEDEGEGDDDDDDGEEDEGEEEEKGGLPIIRDLF